MGKVINPTQWNLAIAWFIHFISLGILENRYVLYVMTLGFVYIISIYGMNILSGFTGQLSLAHAGFFAIGAYAVGILTTKVGLNFWLALFLAVVITSVIGLAIGVIALRTKEHFLRFIH